jgi:hypothetical protein
VVFKGTTFKSAPSVTFEGASFEVDASKPTELGVYVTSAVTKTAGHKELKAVPAGGGKPTMLAIDVLN